MQYMVRSEGVRPMIFVQSLAKDLSQRLMRFSNETGLNPITSVLVKRYHSSRVSFHLISSSPLLEL